MIKGPCSNLELLIPGDNIAGTMTDAVGNNESEASGPASVPRELLSNRSKSHFSAKKCLFHPRSRSVDEVFPELPWDETHLKPRSKEEEDDISTVGFANLPSKPPQICNDWVPDKFFTNFIAAGCFSNSPMLQVHLDNNKDSSPPVQQDHSSLGQLFVSNADLASCNPIEQQWVSMVSSSPENNNADVLLCDLDTDSSSTITESCSSPDSEEVRIFQPLFILCACNIVKLSSYPISVHNALIFLFLYLLQSCSSVSPWRSDMSKCSCIRTVCEG